MNQEQFVRTRETDWNDLTQLIDRGTAGRSSGEDLSRVSALYRAVCNDLARARAARFDVELSENLNSLATRTHAFLYRGDRLHLPNAIEILAREFPRTLRKNGRAFALSSALFLLPFLIGLIGALSSTSFASAILPVTKLDEMAEMYSHGFSSGREAPTDSMMAGFYVMNNVGIAFRCFASGIFLGVGSIYFLVYNGLFTGVVAGYVMKVGHGDNIWTFMCSHAPFEITAILVAGAAGLQMGFSLISTGGLTRMGSLRANGRAITVQILGAAVMLGIAAVVEGYWSPSSLPSPLKWAFSATMTLAVGSFLAFAGRERPLFRRESERRGA